MTLNIAVLAPMPERQTEDCGLSSKKGFLVLAGYPRFLSPEDKKSLFRVRQHHQPAAGARGPGFSTNPRGEARQPESRANRPRFKHRCLDRSCSACALRRVSRVGPSNPSFIGKNPSLFSRVTGFPLPAEGEISGKNPSRLVPSMFVRPKSNPGIFRPLN